MTDPSPTLPEIEPEPSAPPDRRLFNVGSALLILLLAYYAFNAQVSSATEVYEGLAMIVLAALPALMWARRATHEFPVFEVFMLTGINIYALPLLNGQSQLQAYSESVVTQAAAAVLLFQIIALVVHKITLGRPRTTPFWVEEIISRDVGRYLGYGLGLTTIYSGIATFSDIIPNDLGGPLRAVLGGIGAISMFIQGRRWGQGDLTYQEKIFFVANIALQVVFSFATLYLIAGISLVVLALLGFVSGGKRLPIIAVVIILPMIALLHNGKTTMREKYWADNDKKATSMPSLSELPGILHRVDSRRPRSPSKKRHNQCKLIERTSLFQMICLVVNETPERLPYLDGETYGQIPGQFVPRFFWADKPTGHISTDTLSIYYGLQRPEDTQKTSPSLSVCSPRLTPTSVLRRQACSPPPSPFCLKNTGCGRSKSPILSSGSACCW